MSSFTWPGTSPVPVYSTLSAFPATASTGSLAIAADTGILYEWFGGAWTAISGTGSVLSVGPFGSTPNGNGLSLSANVLTMQPADATHPGGVSITTQTFAGNKTFSGTIGASNLSGTNTGDVTLGTANGLSLSSQALSLGLSSTSTTGALSSADWNIFNGKQAAFSGLTTDGVIYATSATAVASTLAGTTAYPLISNGGGGSAPTFQQLSLTAGVTGVLPAANGGSSPVTKVLYVDGSRTDTYTPDGSISRPFLTIGASISQVITNNDNSSHQYNIVIAPGTYSETLSFNSSTLYNLVLSSETTASTPLQNTAIIMVSAITSTSNNTQLATLIFNGLVINGAVNLTGDTNGTNFGSTQVLFANCQFNAGNITLNNVNNVNFYNCQVQGSTASTWTNVAFAYLNGAEGFIGGTTLHLVNNGGGNQPSQFSGNYLLMNQTKFYGTITIDAGSELDTLTTYFGSTSVVTNNGTIHSWATNWSSSTTAVTLNNGSTTRLRGDFFYLAPTVNSGATLTNQGEFMPANLDFSQISTPSNPTSGHDKLYFKSDDKLYGLNSSGTETLIGPQLSGLTTDGVIYATSSTAVASTAAGTNHYPLISNGGGGSAPTFQQLGLTTGVTGVLPIANGGTNNGSLAVTAGGTLYTDGTKVVNVGAGTSNQVLTSNGASAPTWGPVPQPSLNYQISTRTSISGGGNGNWTTLGLTMTTPNVASSLWLLSGSIIFSNSGTTVGYSIADFVWAIADGANTVTQPTAITPVAGLTGPMGGTGPVANGWNIAAFLLKTTEIVLNGNTTVYLVPYSSDLIANDVLYSGQITAIRVQ